MKSLIKLILLIALSLACGCGAQKGYLGPELPDSQLSIISMNKERAKQSDFVYKVTNFIVTEVGTDRMLSNRYNSSLRAVKVPSGKTSVAIYWGATPTSQESINSIMLGRLTGVYYRNGRCFVEFNAEAQRSYELKLSSPETVSLSDGNGKTEQLSCIEHYKKA